MAVWFMRWLQGMLCEQSLLFDREITRPAQTPINDHRDDALGARERAYAFANAGALI
jgi:hypothetical protein